MCQASEGEYNALRSMAFSATERGFAAAYFNKPEARKSYDHTDWESGFTSVAQRHIPYAMEVFINETMEAACGKFYCRYFDLSRIKQAYKETGELPLLVIDRLKWRL